MTKQVYNCSIGLQVKTPFTFNLLLFILIAQLAKIGIEL